MKENPKDKRIVFSVIILVLLLLGISVGYAALSTTLNINGSSRINNARWDIHFENLQFNSESVSLSNGDVIPTINTSTLTEVTYSITLNNPGEFYEFTVDARNSGTIDGMVSGVSSKMNNSEITILPSFLNYSVTYDDGEVIQANHALYAGEKETYKIRVEYRSDITANQLPTVPENYTFSFSVYFVQADNNAYSRIPYVYNSSSSHVYDGATLSTLGTVYDRALQTGKKSFIRYRISNNGVIQRDVGFHFNNRNYYLLGGNQYLKNKQLLDSISGFDCNLVNLGMGTLSYVCSGDDSNGHISVSAVNKGTVSAGLDWTCQVNDREESFCYTSSGSDDLD